MNTNIYVWYRVTRDDAETDTLVRSMMARLACRSGIHGQLLRKHGEPHVWMEVYEDITDADGFLRQMADKVEALDLEMLLDSPRRVEMFIPGTPVYPTCAR